MVEISLIFTIATVILCAIGDIFIYIMVKKLGGTLGKGLKILGISIFALLVYMVIDLAIVFGGLLNIQQYFIVHYIIETLIYIPAIFGLYLILKALRGM